MATGEKKHLSSDEENRLRPFIDDDERRAYELRSYQAAREEKIAKQNRQMPPPVMSEDLGETPTLPPEAT